MGAINGRVIYSPKPVIALIVFGDQNGQLVFLHGNELMLFLSLVLCSQLQH